MQTKPLAQTAAGPPVAGLESEIYASLANHIVRLILMPTEACNFRCTYCYEDFSMGRMQDAVVRGVKRFLGRRAHELETLELSWFGGEPLLALDVIRDVMRHAKSLSQRHPRLSLRSDVTTNGDLLTPRHVAELLDLGVKTFQVSFDGSEAVHDRTRRRAGGGGTFASIWGNLLQMRGKAERFAVVVRLHVHGGNLAALPEFLEAFALDFGSDERFRLFFKDVSPLGGPWDMEFPFLRGTARQAALQDLQARAAALGLTCLTKDASPLCYASRGNAFVVRADGRLNKCTVALGDPGNDVGRLHEDGRLELWPARMHAWMRGLWSGQRAELECPMRDLPLSTTTMVPSSR